MFWRRILIGIAGIALLGVLFFGIQRWRIYRATPKLFPTTAPAHSSEEIRTNWKADVKRIVEQYDRDQNALVARDALIGLTVALEDQEAHLALVLALQAAIDGQKTAATQWQAAKQKLVR
jgi:hypothetical protein